jgi:hypothetical protein
MLDKILFFFKKIVYFGIQRGLLELIDLLNLVKTSEFTNSIIIKEKSNIILNYHGFYP